MGRVVPSVIGNVVPVEVLGLGVVWTLEWVIGDSVFVEVLDWAKGLVFGEVDSAINVVAIDAGGVFEEIVSSCKVELGPVLPSLGMPLMGGLLAVVV